MLIQIQYICSGDPWSLFYGVFPELPAPGTGPANICMEESNMLDFEKLAAAMGDLDEDTVVEILNGVMADGGKEADKAMAK